MNKISLKQICMQTCYFIFNFGIVIDLEQNGNTSESFNTVATLHKKEITNLTYNKDYYIESLFWKQLELHGTPIHDENDHRVTSNFRNIYA